MYCLRLVVVVLHCLLKFNMPIYSMVIMDIYQYTKFQFYVVIERRK